MYALRQPPNPPQRPERIAHQHRVLHIWDALLKARNLNDVDNFVAAFNELAPLFRGGPESIVKCTNPGCDCESESLNCTFGVALP